MCKSVPKCIKGLVVPEVRSASHSCRGKVPKGLRSMVGIKCMNEGGGILHRTADTSLGLWSCLEIDPSVHQIVLYVHVLAKSIVHKAKWSGAGWWWFFPLMSIYSPAQNNFQQFSKSYLPTSYVWFYVSSRILHGKFIQAKIFFQIFSSLNTLRWYASNQELWTQKKNNAFLHLNCNVNIFVAKNWFLITEQVQYM